MEASEAGFKPLDAPFPLSPNFVAAERITNAIDIAMDLWFSARDRSMSQIRDLVVAAGLEVVKIHPTRSLVCSESNSINCMTQVLVIRQCSHRGSIAKATRSWSTCSRGGC